jgi:hypothetical protein
MTNWKRLTQPNGAHVDVNMDHVIYMLRNSEANTSVFFDGSFQNDPTNATCINVTETPDNIHSAYSLHSN